MAQASPNSSRRTLLRSTEVCELLKVQPYVLRSWEKEFPSLGVAKEADGPRYYRRTDVDQVLRIKQLVFGDGLTIAGARRKLEDERAASSSTGLPFEDEDDASIGAVLSAATRVQLDGIRSGLKSLLALLDGSGSSGAAKPNGNAPVEAPPTKTPKPRTSRPPARAARSARSKGSGRTSRSARG